MRKQIATSIEELNRIEYSEYYRKEQIESYSIYKKTHIILKALRDLKINLLNKRILDIGFGTGSTLLHLNRINCKIYGIEYVKEACYNLNSKNKNVNDELHLILGSALHLPYKNDAFDIIICSHVLEHIKDDHLALMEIWRVLCNRGVLLFLTPNENYGAKHDLHFRCYSYEDLKKLVKNEFSIIFRLKYRSFIDNLIYKLPTKYEFFNKIIRKFSFLDLQFASKLQNLEDLYVLIKNG